MHLKLKTWSLLFHEKHLLEFKETLINFQNLSFRNAASMSIDLDSLRFRWERRSDHMTFIYMRAHFMLQYLNYWIWISNVTSRKNLIYWRKKFQYCVSISRYYGWISPIWISAFQYPFFSVLFETYFYDKKKNIVIQYNFQSLLRLYVGFRDLK